MLVPLYCEGPDPSEIRLAAAVAGGIRSCCTSGSRREVALRGAGRPGWALLRHSRQGLAREWQPDGPDLALGNDANPWGRRRECGRATLRPASHARRAM